MALIDKASLLMVPSTYEDGTLYNILPSGNKAPDETGNHNAYDQTRADFTFSRGSNLAATRVNASGLIEKGRENLFTNSNTLTGVTLDNLTRTTGHADPFGGNNAALLTENTSTGTHRFYIFSIPASDAVHTYSIYAKPNGRNRFQIVADGGGINAQWNISTGTLIGDSNEIKSNIEDIGDGWYRLSLTYYGAGWIGGYFFNDSGSNSYTGDGTSGVYVFGAQVELGLVATDYIETGSVSATAGVLENTPRIDYSSGAGSLKLEPQRTNLFAQSEYITGFSTSNTGVSIEENATTSPEGVVNAAKIKEDGTNAAHAVRQLTGPTLTSGTDYTFSFFAKKGERSIVALSNTIGASNDANCFFDLENGQVLTNTFNSASIEDFGNGWYRCIATDTADAADDYDTRIYTATADNQFTHQGVSGSGLYIFGLQLESGSYVSSYVPTYGSAATRGADSCSVTGASDVIGQTEGTLFMDVNLSARDSYTYFALAPNLGSTTAYIGMGITSTAFLFEVVNSGVQVVYNYPNSSTGNFKMAFAYKANDFVAYVNGTQVMTDTSGSVPACSQIGLNVFDKDQPLLYKQAVLFNERLSNTELATLTTL